jgi:hypothetical protein
MEGNVECKVDKNVDGKGKERWPGPWKMARNMEGTWTEHGKEHGRNMEGKLKIHVEWKVSGISSIEEDTERSTPRYLKGPQGKKMASEHEREIQSVPHENGGGGAVSSLPRHHHVSAGG